MYTKEIVKFLQTFFFLNWQKYSELFSKWVDIMLSRMLKSHYFFQHFVIQFDIEDTAQVVISYEIYQTSLRRV